MRVGLTEIVMIGMSLGLPLLAFLMFWSWIGKRAASVGYGSRRQYLAAIPQTDAQKDEAIEFLLRGLVICMLGLFFRPLILVGLLPLYFGGRKVMRAWFGLGNADA